MKKSLVILVLASVMLLSACSSGLSDAFDEDEVIARAKETVEIINTMDYDAIVADFRDDLESRITAESIEDVWDDLLTDAGEFEEFASATAYSQEDTEVGVEYAVVILKAKYENATFIYTISMDEDLEIVGMYMK